MPFTKGHKINIGNKFAEKHGMSATKFWRIFMRMNERCMSKKEYHFKYYGSKGVKVEWMSFETFKKDMYRSYLNHVKKYGDKNTTIDRIDCNGNYSKENCRWATSKVQGRNKTNNHLLTYKGETKPLSEWAEQIGINRRTLRSRIAISLWSVEKALTFKTRKYNVI